MNHKRASTHNSHYCRKGVGTERQRDDKHRARTGSNKDVINFQVHCSSNCVSTRFYIKPDGQTKKKIMQT